MPFGLLYFSGMISVPEIDPKGGHGNTRAIEHRRFDANGQMYGKV